MKRPFLSTVQTGGFHVWPVSVIRSVSYAANGASPFLVEFVEAENKMVPDLKRSFVIWGSCITVPENSCNRFFVSFFINEVKLTIF